MGKISLEAHSLPEFPVGVPPTYNNIANLFKVFVDLLPTSHFRNFHDRDSDRGWKVCWSVLISFRDYQDAAVSSAMHLQ